MISGLILAFSLAAFGLLVLGERMGLPTGVAAYAVLGVLLIAGIGVALSTMTSRLHRFMVGPPRGVRLGLVALVAMLALLGFSGIDVEAPDPLNRAVAIVLGLVGAPLIAPFNPWRNLGRFAADERAIVLRDRDPGEGTRGALPIVAIAGMLALTLILATTLPMTIERLAGATGWPRGRLWLFAIVFAGAVPLLGGMTGLRRAAIYLAAVTILLAILPLAWSFGRGLLAQGDPAMVRRAIETGLDALPGLLPGTKHWPELATGFVLGLIVQQVAAPVAGRFWRMQGVILGVALALAIALVARGAGEGLADIIATRIAALPPAQWPVFVFDESLRGWLTVCGQIPQDAPAAARACGMAGARLPLPAGTLAFEPGLAAPALAVAEGLPIILGFIWGVLAPLIALAGLGMAMLHAASSFSERVLFRILSPRALRGGRLAFARLSLVALVAGLYALEAYALRLDPRFASMVLLGLTLIALSAMLGYRLIAAIRLIRRWREGERPRPQIGPHSPPVQA